MSTSLERFLALLDAGKDSPLLRYSLAVEYMKRDDVSNAIAQLALALEGDPNFSAAWKLYGKALVEAGKHEAACDVFERGISVAEGRGDAQAVKEMRVFKRRAEKALMG